jgi:hypothetical protein
MSVSTITIHPEVAGSITVKNTFIDVKKKVEAPLRRSNSVPRAFKLGTYVENQLPCREKKLAFSAYVSVVDADESTNASEKDFPDRWCDQDPSDCCSDCTDDGDALYQGVESLSELSLEKLAPPETGKCKVKLSLDDMVNEQSRRRLRSQARPFTSSRTPPGEVVKMVANAVEVLMTSKDIVDVHVHDGGMGGTTMIMAQSSCAKPDPQWTFSLVKDALLNTAEQSESTYVLGYGARPFNNLDALSFSANIAHVPAAHRETACWDHYEKGFCSSYSSCRWSHPSEIDMMRIVVMIKKQGMQECL